MEASFEGRWRSEKFGDVCRIRGSTCVGSGGRAFEFAGSGTRPKITIDDVTVEGISNDGKTILWDDSDVWNLVPDLCVDLAVPHGVKLGLRFVTPKLGSEAIGPLCIQAISVDGEISRWNNSDDRAAGSVVRPGDEIIEVNGDRGDIRQALKAVGALRLLIRQAPERQVVEEFAFDERRGPVVFKLFVDGRMDFHANGVLCLRGVRKLEVCPGELFISGCGTDDSPTEWFALHEQADADEQTEAEALDKQTETFRIVKAMFDKSSEGRATDESDIQGMVAADFSGHWGLAAGRIEVEAAYDALSLAASEPRRPDEWRRAHEQADVPQATLRFNIELERSGQPSQGSVDAVIEQLAALPADQRRIGVLVEIGDEEQRAYESASAALWGLRLKFGKITY